MRYIASEAPCCVLHLGEDVRGGSLARGVKWLLAQLLNSTVHLHLHIHLLDHRHWQPDELQGGREGGRKGGREGGRKGGREGEREGGKEKGRETDVFICIAFLVSTAASSLPHPIYL